MADTLLIVLVSGGAALLAGGVATLLALAARPSRDGEQAAQDALVARVEDCLPKTQCAQCGYPGCRPYAEAILADRVGIDRCPPGGMRTIEALATLLDRDVVPLFSERAEISEVAMDDVPRVARIVEADCIGCALCLPACPTDAIVGAPRLMHVVVAAECTGCELCLAPCPVDCIVMTTPAPVPHAAMALSHP